MDMVSTSNEVYGYKLLLLLPYPDSLITCFVCSSSGHHNITICCHGNGCDFANSALCLHDEIRQRKKKWAIREKLLFKDKRNFVLNSVLKPLTSVGQLPIRAPFEVTAFLLLLTWFPWLLWEGNDMSSLEYCLAEWPGSSLWTYYSTTK